MVAQANHLTAPHQSPGWDDGGRVLWYGERSIVNAVVSHIARSATPAAAVRALLEEVICADGGRPSRGGRVSDARLIAEIGLADFGNPDLLLACRTEGEELPYLVFRVGQRRTPRSLRRSPNYSRRRRR
jgi:hypothetical protein